MPDFSKSDVSRLKSIAGTLSVALDNLYTLERLAVTSPSEKLAVNKKNLLVKIDKYHKLFSEVYKNPKFSLKEDTQMSSFTHFKEFIAEAVDAEGKPLKVGDAVEFKSDVEQVGVIKSISGNSVTLVPPRGGRFYGHYIGKSSSTVETAGSLWKIEDKSQPTVNYKVGNKVKFAAESPWSEPQRQTHLGKIISISPSPGGGNYYTIGPVGKSFTGNLESKVSIMVGIGSILSKA